MKMVIEKNKAIRAIETEPILANGRWFSGSNVKTCKVCAVGSVLRSHCFTTKVCDPDFSIETMGEMQRNDYSSCGDLETNDEHAHLANLSCVFESHADEIGANTEEMRALLVSEICATWPESFEIEFHN